MRTGLEPATPGVTGRYSNQLNYRTNLFRLMHFSQMRMQRYAKNRYLQIFCVLFKEFSSFNFDDPLVFFYFRLVQFRDFDFQDAVSDLSLNLFPVCIVGKEDCLAEF